METIKSLSKELGVEVECIELNLEKRRPGTKRANISFSIKPTDENSKLRNAYYKSKVSEAFIQQCIIYMRGKAVAVFAFESNNSVDSHLLNSHAYWIKDENGHLIESPVFQDDEECTRVITYGTIIESSGINKLKKLFLLTIIDQLSILFKKNSDRLLEYYEKPIWCTTNLSKVENVISNCTGISTNNGEVNCYHHGEYVGSIKVE